MENEDMEKSNLMKLLRMNPDSCLAIHEGQKIIGCVLGAFNGRRAWIYHLAVLPKYQKCGYGTKLLNAAEKVFIKQQAQKISLFVIKNNLDVVPFYVKNGFEVNDEGLIYLTKKI